MSAAPKAARLARLQQSSLRDRIAGEIKQAIIQRKFQPGERIAEHELAMDLGVSRTPIREAVRILEQQGLLVTRPKIGTFVASVDWKRARDGLLVRITLEDLAIRQALVQMSLSEWEQLCGRLADILRRMEKALDRRDFGLANELDVEWHNQHIEAAGNRYLSQAWKLVGLPFIIWSPDHQLYPQHPDKWGVGFTDRHAALLDALRSRDPEKCSRILRAQILFNLDESERGQADNILDRDR